jgi:putative NIF3 family GTP cyclohydrolase 1 type 2
MNMQVVQIIGDPDMKVSRVGVLPGGGSLGLGTEYMPMRYMRLRNADVLICGDITEWTLPAYVRDAYQLGFHRAILVLGHERSEEPGMKHLGAWLADIVNDTPVVFLDAEEPFTYL